MNEAPRSALAPVRAADEHVYSVETHVWNGTLQSEMTDIDEAERITRLVENTRHWRDRFNRPLKVYASSKACSFASVRGYVAYERSVERHVVAHEMAHVITHGPMHGPDWRAEYVALTEILYGAESADKLHEAFVGNGLPLVRLRVTEGPLLPPELFYAQVGHGIRTTAHQPERVFAL